MSLIIILVYKHHWVLSLGYQFMCGILFCGSYSESFFVGRLNIADMNGVWSWILTQQLLVLLCPGLRSELHAQGKLYHSLYTPRPPPLNFSECAANMSFRILFTKIHFTMEVCFMPYFWIMSLELMKTLCYWRLFSVNSLTKL
jgi:hypothetical protein